MFYQTMYILTVLILLSLLVIEINSQGTFVHSDLGGHIVTNQIKFPNVNWQYAELFRGVSSFTSSSFVPGVLRRCGGIYFFVFDMFVLYIWTINRICKN